MKVGIEFRRSRHAFALHSTKPKLRPRHCICSTRYCAAHIFHRHDATDLWSGRPYANNRKQAIHRSPARQERHRRDVCRRLRRRLWRLESSVDARQSAGAGGVLRLHRRFAGICDRSIPALSRRHWEGKDSARRKADRPCCSTSSTPAMGADDYQSGIRARQPGLSASIVPCVMSVISDAFFAIGVHLFQATAVRARRAVVRFRARLPVFAAWRAERPARLPRSRGLILWSYAAFALTVTPAARRS